MTARASDVNFAAGKDSGEARGLAAMVEAWAGDSQRISPKEKARSASNSTGRRAVRSAREWLRKRVRLGSIFCSDPDDEDDTVIAADSFCPPTCCKYRDPASPTVFAAVIGGIGKSKRGKLGQTSRF